MVKLHAPAKINLFLKVLAREVSGFHQLETLFASLEFGDTLTLVETASGISLETEGHEVGPTRENLVYRAARAFFEESGASGGVQIHLKKRIPPAAGLGGGSSDAATALLGLNALYPQALDRDGILGIAGALGSDVPFFLSPSPFALAWGRGHRVLPLPPLPAAWVLLALPPVSVSTPEAYRLLAEDRGENSTTPAPRIFPLAAFSSWERLVPRAENDFQEVIFRDLPLLAEIRDALEGSESLIALLSGSGAALFGVFLEEASAVAAKDRLTPLFPETRFVLTRTAAAAPGWSNSTGG